MKLSRQLELFPLGIGAGVDFEGIENWRFIAGEMARVRELPERQRTVVEITHALLSGSEDE
jgi:hypothetical protein